MKTITRLSIVSGLILATTTASANWYSSTNDTILASFQRDLNRVATTVSDTRIKHETDPLQLVVNSSLWTPEQDQVVASFQRDLNRRASNVSDTRIKHETDPLQLAVNSVLWTPEQNQIVASFQRDLDRQATTVAGEPGITDDQDALPEMFRFALLDHPSRIGKGLASVKIVD